MLRYYPLCFILPNNKRDNSLLRCGRARRSTARGGTRNGRSREMRLLTRAERSDGSDQNNKSKNNTYPDEVPIVLNFKISPRCCHPGTGAMLFFSVTFTAPTAKNLALLFTRNANSCTYLRSRTYLRSVNSFLSGVLPNDKWTFTFTNGTSCGFFMYLGI